MEGNPFADTVKEEFAFLISDYDYRVVKESYEPALMGNAGVLLASPLVIISIVKDRGQVLINIGKASRPRAEWFEFTDIVRYFSADETMNVYQFGPIPYDDPAVKDQLARLAMLALKYCIPMLRGDFSMEEEIRTLEKKRLDMFLKRS